jgi:MtaA/CmuA family methyltransferase
MMAQMSLRERFLNRLCGKDVDMTPVGSTTTYGVIDLMKKCGYARPLADRDPEAMTALGLAGHKYAGFEWVKAMGWDITILSEALGCELGPAHMDIQHCIARHPFAEDLGGLEFPLDFLERGRFPIYKENFRLLKEAVADKLVIFGHCEGAFTCGANLVGVEQLLKWCFKEPHKVLQVLEVTKEAAIAAANFAFDHGSDYFLFGEPTAGPALISPRLFQKFVLPITKEIVNRVHGPIILHICGNTDSIIEMMCESGVIGISIEEKADLKRAVPIAHKMGVKVFGNVATATTLFQGTPAQSYQESIQALENGTDFLCPGVGSPPKAHWKMFFSLKKPEMTTSIILEGIVPRPRILIVGGVAGGATAATRARRISDGAEIIVFEKGAYVSFANCGLPYYVGDVIKDRDDLEVTTPEALRARYRIDVRILSEVVGIDRDGKTLSVKDLRTGQVYDERYDKLILSPGSTPVRPAIIGIDASNVFTLRDIPDAVRIRAIMDGSQPGTAVVAGAGFIGLEMVENLVLRGVKTTLIEKCSQIMPALDPEMADLLLDHMSAKGVEICLGNSITAIIPRVDTLEVKTDQGRVFEVEMVIVSIGIRPETGLARGAGLEIGPQGGIQVDETMRTSDPHIYAVGDAVETRNRVTGTTGITALAGPANKQGRIAADNALGRHSLYNGTLGTSVVKIFNCTVAATGASEKVLNRCHIPYLVSYTHSDSHAKYYPDARPMAIKLLFAPDDGKVLGAQIVGETGVDKRIDVLATAIFADMSVHDLEELELAYAPPFSSAKDPVNVAGYVAANILKGDLKNVHWHELGSEQNAQSVLIDLRNDIELQRDGKIKDAHVIPLNDLATKLPKLDPNRDYILYCAIGLRGYIAHRMMTQKGFVSRNLSGGFKTHQAGGGSVESHL